MCKKKVVKRETVGNKIRRKRREEKKREKLKFELCLSMLFLYFFMQTKPNMIS